MFSVLKPQVENKDLLNQYLQDTQKTVTRF